MDMQQNCRWHCFENADQVAQAVCHEIIESANQAIANHGLFKLVLAGGSTPEKIYQLLSSAQTNWSKWHLYFGDERCLPPDHADRNSTMVFNALIGKIAIPANLIYPIPAELGPDQGATKYSEVIAGALPFDMVLLGMGEDGHTASLFPGHRHNLEQLVHAVYQSPKPPPERVSISAKALSNANRVLFVITGSNKQEALSQWRSGHQLPVATIMPSNAIDIYVDKDALAE